MVYLSLYTKVTEYFYFCHLSKSSFHQKDINAVMLLKKLRVLLFSFHPLEAKIIVGPNTNQKYVYSEGFNFVGAFKE